MLSPYEKIKNLLKSNNIWYEELEHEPVFTSEQAAAVRGLSIDSGAKSLLLKAKKDFVLVVLPGDEKLDYKKLKRYLGVKGIRFATPEEVVDQMGCEIGACYPFGNVANLRTLVDKTLSKNEIVSCNPGRHDISLKFKFSDYKNLLDPEMVEVAA